MSDPSQATLQALICDYRDAKCPKATAMMEHISNTHSWKGFPEVLRYFLYEPRPRDPCGVAESASLMQEVDDLMAFYSLLEVAILAGVISGALPEDLKRDIRETLDQPVIQRFLTRRYPQLLLSGVLSRGKEPGGEEERAPRPGEFYGFLELKDFIESDVAVDIMLYLSAGGVIDDWDLSDTLAALTGPDACAECMLKAPEEQNVRDASLHGFFRLLSFCGAFEKSLPILGADPILQSACWHYFQVRLFHPEVRLLNTLLLGLSQISRWQKSDNAHVDGMVEPRELLSVVRKLFSPDYAEKYESFHLHRVRVRVSKPTPVFVGPTVSRLLSAE